jgi:hypothetical protein
MMADTIHSSVQVGDVKDMNLPATSLDEAPAPQGMQCLTRRLARCSGPSCQFLLRERQSDLNPVLPQLTIPIGQLCEAQTDPAERVIHRKRGPILCGLAQAVAQHLQEDTRGLRVGLQVAIELSAVDLQRLDVVNRRRGSVGWLLVNCPVSSDELTRTEDVEEDFASIVGVIGHLYATAEQEHYALLHLPLRYERVTMMKEPTPS